MRCCLALQSITATVGRLCLPGFPFVVSPTATPVQNAASTLSAEEFNAIVGPVANEPLALDLTDAAAWDRVYDTADKLLQTFVTVDRLRAVENALLAKQRELPTMVHLAAKLATSKALLATCPPVFVTMLVALYNEKNRMSTKQEHPNGENFLVNKAREMEWLFEAAPASSWEIVYVDDGCPQGSGKLAEEVCIVRGGWTTSRISAGGGSEQANPCTGGRAGSSQLLREVSTLGVGRDGFQPGLVGLLRFLLDLRWIAHGGWGA